MSDLSKIRATRSSRIRDVFSWLASPLKPFRVALVPDRHVDREVRAARYGLPLVLAIVCACVAAFVIGTRLDVAPMVRAMDAMSENGKPAELKTDREIDEDIAKLEAVMKVKLGVDAVVMTPLGVLGLALGLLLLARFVGGKPTMARTLTVASIAAVPGAVKALVIAVVAWRQPQVFPDELEGMLKFPRVIPDGHPMLARLFAGVDVFTWWSVVLVAVGMCAAADLKPRKSIVTVAIGFALYLVVTRIIMGGAAR